MRKHFRSLAVLAAVGASGCTYIVATPAVQGRAYVVRNAFVTSDFWNCDATSGEPTCYQTAKAPLPAGTNK
jgi:hypothetical protein